MPLASAKTQDFVQTCLLRIEREFGIGQAKVLSNALRLKRNLDKFGATAFGICPQYLPHDDGSYELYQGTDSKVGFMGPEVLLDATFQAVFPPVASIEPVH